MGIEVSAGLGDVDNWRRGGVEPGAQHNDGTKKDKKSEILGFAISRYCPPDSRYLGTQCLALVYWSKSRARNHG